MDSLDFIIDYEHGQLSEEDIVIGFSHLIRTGAAWTLQGHYGRTAQSFIEQGIITPEGEVDWDVYNDLATY